MSDPEWSGAAILAGLRQRRAYVSMGRQVTFQARVNVNGNVFDVGSDVGEQQGELTFTASVFSAPSTAYAQIINNGQVVAEVPVEQEQTKLHYTTPAAPSQSNWYRLDVYGEDGLALVMTNPIFAGLPKTPQLLTYGDFMTADQ